MLRTHKEISYFYSLPGGTIRGFFDGSTSKYSGPKP